mgnify:FL=1
METQKTDKNLLAEGLKTMGITLFLMFLGPLILHTGFSNSEKPLYIPIVTSGFLICSTAIYFGFKGIRLIMKSLFGD